MPAQIIHREFLSLSSIGWLIICEKAKQGISQQTIKRSKKKEVEEYFALALPEKQIIGAQWYEDIRGKCRLWDMWEKGIYLDYNQRLLLFTNLKYLYYTHGNSVFDDVMKFYNEETYKNHTCNVEQVRAMLSNRTLCPLPCVIVGYEQITIPEFYKRRAGGDKACKRVQNTLPKIPLEELDTLLDEKFPLLLSEKGITYIKAQTACGKTERVIRWLLDQDLENKRIIYSAPTYNTIDEFVKRFKQAYFQKCIQNTGKAHILQEAFQGFESDNLDAYPIYPIPKGNYQKKDLLLLELGMPPQTYQTERNKAIRTMMEEKNKGLFVCTHNLIANLKGLRADVIIIDENIEDALVDTIEYSQSGLSSILPYIDIEKRQQILGLIDQVKSAKRGESISLNPLKDALINFDLDGYINTDVKQNGIMKAFQAESANISVKNKGNTIRFVQRSSLIDNAIENDIPIKLLSATPKNTLLSKLYKTANIKVEEFPLAENKGKIVQFLDTTGAKGMNCSNVHNIIDYACRALSEEEIKECYVLSYKDSIAQWQKAGFNIPSYSGVDLHLANNAGLDCLKGKKIIVAGKYDDNDDVYLDKYFDLFPDAEKEPKRKQQSVEINGKTMRLFLWDDEILREIQLEKIRQFVEQATGRARALREQNGEVYIFCNYPIADADEFAHI